MSWEELGILLGVLVAWIVLSRWVLPFFGVPTCMSGACTVDRRPAVTDGTSRGAEQGEETR